MYNPVVDNIFEIPETFHVVFLKETVQPPSVEPTFHIKSQIKHRTRLIYFCFLRDSTRPFGPEPSVFSSAVEKLKN
jgi:hypothetical protein